MTLSGLIFLGCEPTEPLVKARPSLVAPIVTELPYSFDGIVGRNWGGDELEVFDSEAIHYVRLAGVVGPEPGQHYWRGARIFLWDKFIGKQAQIKILGHDDCKCEVGTVCVDGADFGLLLLENGLARYDKSTSDNPKYAQAEERAQLQKLGVWSESNSVAPRQFRAIQQQKYHAFLKALRAERK